MPSRHYENVMDPRDKKFDQTKNEFYLERALELLNKCQAHTSPGGTLYCGGLGPHVYLPFLLATTVHRKDSKIRQKYLAHAQQAAESALKLCNPSYRRITLLESPWVGAMTLLAAIQSARGQAADGQHTARQVMEFLSTATSHHLNDQECEVLYGRCGAMASVMFLRQHLADDIFHDADELLIELATSVLEVGRSNSQQPEFRDMYLPLVWQWRGKVYLGAAHGVAGILHTLLCLPLDIRQQVQSRVHFPIETTIADTIEALHQHYCFGVNGNLKSSIESSGGDRLVHWCHGAPGYVLLLLRAHASLACDSDQFLQRATNMTEKIVWPRGLLKKGVGLCHGIGGNAMIFLALSNNCPGPEQRNWIHMAQVFVDFSLGELHALERVPDRPYSLYEGMAGFVYLLLYLSLCRDIMGKVNPKMQGILSSFPFYDFGMFP